MREFFLVVKSMENSLHHLFEVQLKAPTAKKKKKNGCFDHMQSGYSAWLQTSYHDCDCERFIETNCIRQPEPEATAQFILQPQHTDNPQNISEGTTSLHQEHTTSCLLQL